MNIRKSIVTIAMTASLAIVSATAPPTSAATASNDLYQQSSESSSQTLMAMRESPVTMPIATSTSLSIMTGHYLIYCPIAKATGWEGQYSQQCVF